MKKVKCLALVFSVFLFVLCMSVLADEYNGYIVKLRSEDACLFADSEYDSIREINSSKGLVKAENDTALEMLLESGNVISYEPDCLMYTCGYEVNDNEQYTEQKWFYDYINASFAWDMSITGKDVKVAVIDTGVNKHRDIKDNLLEGKNYIDDNFLPVPMAADFVSNDYLNHGTGVAGLIAAGCNSMDTVGLSFNAGIVPLRVFDSVSSTESSYIVEAIYDAVDEFGCDVINLSLSSAQNIKALEEAVNYASNKGVIVVAAAGNKGNTGYHYPASYDCVISVANAEKCEDGLRIKATSQVNDMVDIAAPGSDVLTLSAKDGEVKQMSGTSFSCPLVSAAAALAKSVKPDITPQEFQQLVKQTANGSYLSENQNEEYWGSGLLDVKALILELLKDEEYFVSDVCSYDGNDFFTVTNMSDIKAIDRAGIMMCTYGENKHLEKSYSTVISLAPMSHHEISVSDLGFSDNVKITVVTDFMSGDVNADGYVNIRDASAVLRYNAGYTVEILEFLLDVNGDGISNEGDAAAILRHCAGKDVGIGKKIA